MDFNDTRRHIWSNRTSGQLNGACRNVGLLPHVENGDQHKQHSAVRRFRSSVQRNRCSGTWAQNASAPQRTVVVLFLNGRNAAEILQFHLKAASCEPGVGSRLFFRLSTFARLSETFLLDPAL